MKLETNMNFLNIINQRLGDNMTTDKSLPAYELTKYELTDSRLAELAKEAGHASLNSFLNDHQLWSTSIAEIESMLLADTGNHS